MKIHSSLIMSIGLVVFLSVHAGFAQTSKNMANKEMEKIMKAAGKTSLEAHQEIQKLTKPYLNKIHNKYEQRRMLRKKGAPNKSTPNKSASNKGSKQGSKQGSSPVSSQKRVGSTGDIGGAVGADKIKFEKKKRVIPADAVY